MAGLETSISFLSAAGMLLIGGWLLRARFSSPVNRSFATFLLMLATRTIVLRSKNLAIDPSWVAFWGRLADYAVVLVLGSLLWFVAVYANPNPARPPRWILPTIVGAGFATILWLAVGECPAECVVNGVRIRGPIVMLGSALQIAYAGAAFMLARRAMLGTPRASGELIMSVAFLLPLILGLSSATWYYLHGFATIDAPEPSIWPGLNQYGMVVAWAITVGAIFAQFIGGRKLATWVHYTLLALIYAATIATGIAVGASPEEAIWPRVIGGVWQMIMAALLAYALVQHRLFDTGAKLRFAFSSGTVAALFIAIFFFTSELAASKFQDITNSSLLGIALAAPVVFLMAPLQQLAERMGRQSDSSPIAQLTNAERRSLYRDQVVLVWADGNMGRKERAMLDQLCDKLGILPAEASAIERESLQASMLLRAPSKNASTSTK